MDDAVSFLMLVEADAVLHNHQRHLIALLQHVQGIAEAYRVNLPAPVICLHKRILHFLAHVTIFLGVKSAGKAHVVGEGQIVNLAFFQKLQIARLHLDIGAETLPLLQDVARIMSPALHICKDEGPIHFLQGSHLVKRCRTGRIYRAYSHHAADVHVRVNLVPLNDCHSGSHELVMSSLIHDLIPVLALLIAEAGILKSVMVAHAADDLTLIVNLVEGHPVLYLVLVTLKADLGIAHEKLNHLAVAPAAILIGKMQRNLKM